jgi:hypothetical protein
MRFSDTKTLSSTSSLVDGGRMNKLYPLLGDVEWQTYRRKESLVGGIETSVFQEDNTAELQ